MSKCRHTWTASVLNAFEPSAVFRCAHCGLELDVSPSVVMSERAENESLNKRLQGLRATCRQAWRQLYMTITDADGNVSLKNPTDSQIASLGVICGTLHGAATTPENSMLLWARDRWMAEVGDRPLCNVHRRDLDDTWRQVVSYLGGNPDLLLGPAHDELVELQEKANE